MIKLQEIDLQLLILEEEKGDLPQKVKRLSDQCGVIHEKLEAIKQDKKANELEMKKVEADVEMLKDKLKKYKVQLYQVKTNKEYDAMTTEIETSEQKIDEYEYSILELEEKIKKQDEEIVQLTLKNDDLDKELNSNKKDLEARMALTHENEKKLQSNRNKLVGTVPKPTLSAYERIRGARAGKAIALLKNGACSECSTRIPPQRGLEIRMMNSLYLCEVCGRILVWIPENEVNE